MIRVEVVTPCEACGGFGFAPGCGHGEGVSHVVDCGTRRACPKCFGTGETRREHIAEQKVDWHEGKDET